MNHSVAFIQAFVAATLFGNLAFAQTNSFGRPADRPVPRTDRNSQIAHEQLLEKARKGGIDVYFLGDSITRRWGATDYPEFLANWNTNFFGWNAGNFGWGADRIENILWRVENGELDGVSPKIKSQFTTQPLLRAMLEARLRLTFRMHGVRCEFVSQSAALSDRRP
jgi:hypothetical protein